MTPKTIFFLVILFVFAIFVVQNAEVVEIRFLFWSTQASRAIVLLITFIMGLASGWLSVWILKTKGKIEEKHTDVVKTN